MKETRTSTVVAELIRQALDCMTYKFGDRPLRKHEILGYRSINQRIVLRGNTNLEAYGWAIYSGPAGTWQVQLNHNRYVRGTPKEIQISPSAEAMLNAIPEGHGLYRLASVGSGYQAEEVLVDEAYEGELGQADFERSMEDAEDGFPEPEVA